MKAYQQALNLLDTLKLRGLAHRLDEVIHDAKGVKVIEGGYRVCFDSWAEMMGNTVS